MGESLSLKPNERARRDSASRIVAQALVGLSLFCGTSTVLLGADESRQIFEILEDATQTVAEVKEPQQRGGMLREVADAWYKAGNRDKALQILADVARHLDTPEARASEDWVLARSMLAADQARMGDFEAALHTAGAINVDAREGALYWIVEAAATTGNMDLARKVTHDITDKFRLGMCLGHIAEAYGRDGNLDEAMKTVAEMSEEFKATELVMIALQKIKVGKNDDANRIASLIESPLHRSRLLLEIATAELQEGDPRSADAMYQKAVDQAPGQLLGVRAVFQAKRGLFDEAVDMAMGIGEADDRNRWLQEIAKVEALLGEGMRAVETVDKITSESDYKSPVLLEVARMQAQTGHIPEALRTAESIQEPYQAAAALQHIARLQFKWGNPSAAKLTLRKSLEKVELLEIGGGTKVIALYEIAETYVGIGDSEGGRETFRRAVQVVASYPEESYRAILRRDIAAAQAKVGQEADAVALARNEPSALIKLNVLIGVSTGLMQRADIKRDSLDEGVAAPSRDGGFRGLCFYRNGRNRVRLGRRIQVLRCRGMIASRQ